jgi:branched-chain amino acid transport system ATP-binding protein
MDKAAAVAAPVLVGRGLHKRFGGVVANAGIDFELRPREVHAVIGPNGGGKTTLLGQLMGEIPPDLGSVAFAGGDITGLTVPERVMRGLARSYQVTSVFPGFTVLENVAFGMRARRRISSRFWRLASTGGELGEAAAAILRRVGLSGRSGVDAAVLSHGEQRQLEIAIALSTNPKVLLLDEPLAGLGLDEGRRMVDLIAGLAGPIAVVLVEHDMDAVFALADRVTVLVDGAVIATGTPTAIRDDRLVRAAYLGESA